KSDPDGLRPDGPAGGATYNDDRWASDRGMNAGYTYKSGKWVWHQTPKSWFSPRYQAYVANPSSYKVYHYNARAVAAARAKAQAAAQARAEAERRRKDGVLVSVLKGNYGTAWNKSKPAARDAIGKVNKVESHLAGAAYETLARVSGAECSEDQGLTVCQTGMPMYGRGGTNVGGTYVTGFEPEYVYPQRLKHERVHTKQWEKAGFSFMPRYFMAGVDPCHNKYEIDADLQMGGYRC
ncbi:hypothetical protein, partial [Streptomyces sp. ADI92-24]